MDRVKEILWASLPSIKAKVYSVEDGNKMVSWKVVRQFGDVTVVSAVSPGPKALDIVDMLLQTVPPYIENIPSGSGTMGRSE